MPDDTLLLADVSRGLEQLPLPVEAPPAGAEGAAAAVAQLRDFRYIADAAAPASTLTVDTGTCARAVYDAANHH